MLTTTTLWMRKVHGSMRKLLARCRPGRKRCQHLWFRCELRFPGLTVRGWLGEECVRCLACRVVR